MFIYDDLWFDTMSSKTGSEKGPQCWTIGAWLILPNQGIALQLSLSRVDSTLGIKTVQIIWFESKGDFYISLPMTCLCTFGGSRGSASVN